MRRKDREISDNQKIKDIILSCHCCRLGLYDDGEVYIIPLSFGYEEKDGRRVFYFHGAREGRKIDLMAKTHSAGFELDTGYGLIEADMACQHSARYQSVIGTGRIAFIEEPKEKRAALQAIMLHCTGKDDWSLPDAALGSVCVFSLEVETLSCKEH